MRSRSATPSCGSRERPTLLPPPRCRRDLAFVFVGAGYAGVEALPNCTTLVRDSAVRYYPMRDEPAALGARRRGAEDPAEIPSRLGELRGPPARQRGRRIHVSTTARLFRPRRGDLSDRDELIRATRSSGRQGCARPALPSLAAARRGAWCRVEELLRVRGTRTSGALGDCAARSDVATPGSVDPPTSAARAPPGPAAGAEPDRRAEAVPLPDARPGGDARPLQGDRRRAWACACAASPAGS